MTKIEWVVKVADAIGGKAESWNPIRAKHKKTGKVGWFCIHASEGCRNCYAERWNGWRGNGVKFRAQDIDNVDIYLDEDVLLRPLTWRKRRAVFACDMTDMFGWWVTDEMLDKIFAVIALTPHCIWMVLTKQSERMREYFTGDVERRSAKASIEFIDLSSGAGRWEKHIQAMAIEGWSTWPRPNVWLGVSAENQEQAEARIPALLQTPAAVRFVSAEPLVGAVDLLKWMRPYVSDAIGLLQPVPRLDWVIAGGESGSKARAMHPDWPRGLRDDCGRAGVAFFFKQWGEYAPGTVSSDGEIVRFAFDENRHEGLLPGGKFPEENSDKENEEFFSRLEDFVADTALDCPAEPAAYRVGRKAAGRLLDGRRHEQIPACAKASAGGPAISHAHDEGGVS
ncbi:MAG: phage Gp37/Gp68 family protein [Rhodospirillales bacterium]|nr:phage Gp37/Gp68 family protein [Rhodospirillales bacterium]